MSNLQNILEDKIEAWRNEAKQLIDSKGDTVISEVTVNQVYGGMRGVKGLICDTSSVSPDTGLIIRNHTHFTRGSIFSPAYGRYS